MKEYVTEPANVNYLHVGGKRKSWKLAVLTASRDETAKIWSTIIGDCVQTLSGHDDTGTSAVLSADGSLVLTAPRD